MWELLLDTFSDLRHLRGKDWAVAVITVAAVTAFLLFLKHLQLNYG